MINFEKMTRQEILKMVEADKIEPWEIPKIYSNDKEIWLEAVRKSSSAFEFASFKLKDNDDILLEAIKKDSIVLQYASERLRDNKQIALKAIRSDCYVLCHISERLRDDEEIVLEAINNITIKKQFVSLLYYVSERIKDDKNIILEIIKKEPESLRYAPERLQNDKEVLELLEFVNLNNSNDNLSSNTYKYWYQSRMNILENIRNQEDRELMKDSITSNSKNNKKIKF